MKSADEWLLDNDAMFDRRSDGDEIAALIAKVQADARAPLEAVLWEVLVACKDAAGDVRYNDLPDIAKRLDALAAKVDAALAEAEAPRG